MSRFISIPVTIVVPCYNEKPTLPNLAAMLSALPAKVGSRYALSYVMVDDGSHDDTWALMRRLFASWPSCRLVRHETNRGIMVAMLTGADAAMADIVCTMDSDCSYDPQQFAAMIPLLSDDVSVVTASPYHHDGETRNVPAIRLFLSRGLSYLYQLVLDQKLATYTSCFRVYRKSALLSVNVRNGGFLGVAEVLGHLDHTGHRIVEYPAVLETRRFGQSKMHVLSNIIGHLGLLAQFGIARLHHRPCGGTR